MTPGTFNLVFAHQFQADERIIFRMKPGADSILALFYEHCAGSACYGRVVIQNRLQHVTTTAGLTEIAISRANSALAFKEALQLISTHIGTMATVGAGGTPSREIDSNPFAGIVAIEVSKTVAGATTSWAWTVTGLGLGLLTTTFPKTVQKALTLLPVLS